MLKRMLALCAGGATLAVAAASGAAAMPATPAAQTATAFLCYSTYQVNPGVWPLSVSNSAHHSAGQLMALGYWSPFAEQSTPTGTAIGNGWYLTCNLPANLKPVASGDLLGRKGGVFTPAKQAGKPGYYPIAASSVSPAA